MTKEELIRNNSKYASQATSKEIGLSIPPKKSVTILTCMDARLDPLRLTGLTVGDAHIIRNAGGRVSDDAIRSLIISYKLLGTKSFYVIHHTDCGMLTFTNKVMSRLLEKSLEPAVLTQNGWEDKGSGYEKGVEARYINFLTMDNLEDALQEDVNRIRNHNLIPNDINVNGFVYDVGNGLLKEIC